MKFNRLRVILLFFITFMTNPVFSAQTDNLLPSERNTIEVFQQSSPKVLYIHRLTAVRSLTHRGMQLKATGAGSGILWNNKGYLVTNFHVIKGASQFSVTMGKMTVPARVIGAEPRKDIAVLKINNPKALAAIQSFKPFDISQTKNLMVGQKAIAIGNPFGFDHSLSIGVVSALGRQVPGVGGVSIHDMIQTDAAVNPGNSGGPLLDSAGRLIGMNTLIYSQTGASAGVGFAVPAEEIQHTVSQIINHGRVSLAGIGIAPVDPAKAAHLGIKQGILIADVLPKTPAINAGLRKTYRNHFGQLILGDVIIGLNGHPVDDYDHYYNLLKNVSVGDEVTLTVVRDGMHIFHKIKTIDVAGL